MSVTHSLQPIAVLGGVRTPFIRAFAQLKSVTADELGIVALKGALKKTRVPANAIDEVIFGNVSTPIHAANIARVIELGSGIDQSKPAHTVSRNCVSGMESIVGAWHAIHEGRAEIIAAGGVESMSNIPLLYSQEFQDWMLDWRRQKGFGQLAHLASFRPSMLKPVVALQVGLTDPTCGLNMGETAEILAEEFQILRDEQDRFAMESHHRAAAAWERGFYGAEVIEVATEAGPVSQDNGIRPGQTLDALSRLKPIFKKNGTVTAGNSSQLTDGGSALIVAAPEAAARLGISPLGTVHAYAIAGLDPRRMGLGPVYAVHRLLEKTGMTLNDFDLFEINEAFAAQVLACLKAMESQEFCRTQLQRHDAIGRIPRDRLNVNGGAIALGHPLGASGNRLVLTLLHALKERGLKRGLATMCIGGGQGMAMWVECSS